MNYLNEKEIITNLELFDKIFASGSHMKHYSGSNRFGGAYVSLTFSRDLQGYLANLYEQDIETEDDKNIKTEKENELEIILKNFLREYCLQKLSSNLNNIKSKATREYVKNKNMYIMISTRNSNITGCMLTLPTTKASKAMLDEIYNILTDTANSPSEISERNKINKIKESIDSNAKSFDSFGAGWLFNDLNNSWSSTVKSSDIDFSKFAWGKGYTINIQHLGVLDPLFGNPETSSYWLNDVSLCFYLIKDVYNKEKDFIDYIKDNYDVEDFSMDEDNFSFEDAIAVGSMTEGLINYMHEKKIADGSALCGITDEDYFQELLLKTDIDLDDTYFNIIKLG